MNDIIKRIQAMSTEYRVTIGKKPTRIKMSEFTFERLKEEVALSGMTMYSTTSNEKRICDLNIIIDKSIIGSQMYLATEF